MDRLAGGLADLVCTMAPVTNPHGAIITESAAFEDGLIRRCASAPAAWDTLPV